MTQVGGMTVPAGATLADARSWLELMKYGEGAHCPCCGQWAKVYQRTLSSSMAKALIQLYMEGDTTEWVHGPTLLKGARSDEGKLRYWGLLEESTERRDDGGRAGYWRVTRAGARFVHGQLRVPRYALVFNGQCLDFDGGLITIRDALRHRFNYAELMGAAQTQRKATR